MGQWLTNLNSKSRRNSRRYVKNFPSAVETIAGLQSVPVAIDGAAAVVELPEPSK